MLHCILSKKKKKELSKNGNFAVTPLWPQMCSSVNLHETTEGAVDTRNKLLHTLVLL